MLQKYGIPAPASFPKHIHSNDESHASHARSLRIHVASGLTRCGSPQMGSAVSVLSGSTAK
jgi:hypothetical protein